MVSTSDDIELTLGGLGDVLRVRGNSAQPKLIGAADYLMEFSPQPAMIGENLRSAVVAANIGSTIYVHPSYGKT